LAQAVAILAQGNTQGNPRSTLAREQE